MTTIYKRGDTAPPLEERLSKDGERIDLSNVDSITLYVGDVDETVFAAEPVEIVDETQAIVRVDWDGAALDQPPGDYDYEWVLQYPDGDQRTVPDDGFETLRITEVAHR